MAGIYIHVPFCKTKCIYCDFYSITDCTSQKAYVRRLIDEIGERAGELPPGEKIETVYFGGGTPSLLETSEIEAILRRLRELYPFASSVPEITMECNPGDVSRIRAKELARLGINRFSIGAQSFDPSALRFLTRRHTPEETVDLVRLLRDAGITNLTLDLIYGIPGIDLQNFRRDLEALVALSPEHISAYSLMYEEGTPLYRGLVQKKVTEVDEDTSIEMSRLVRSFLRENGYEQYEISNFKRSDPHTDYRSHHNSSYWDGTPYLGFGPSAHSYVHPIRSWNPSDLGAYLRHEKGGSEILTKEMQFEEYLLTRLRTSSGIDLSDLKSLCPASRLDVLRQTADNMTEGEEPLLRKKGSVYTLTDRGIDLSDAVLRFLAL